jgi:ankyrin repeat protein
MGQTVAFYLSKTGNKRGLELLAARGVHLDEPDIFGQTPLYYASRDGKTNCVQYLIGLGADTSRVDSISSQTALFYASRDGHLETVKLLV